jgi:hypothetical protein
MVILAWILAFLPSSESVIQKMIFPIGYNWIFRYINQSKTMKNIPRTAFLLVTSLYLFGNQIAHGATDASYIDPKDLKSTELICTMDTSDDYNGDNGFKKSENAGQYMSDNFDREVTTDRPNIFQSLLAGKSPDSNDMTTYISAIITIVVPCVLVAAFNLCNCICCICCRQCCHWCCKGKEKNPCRVCQCIPKTSHYSKEEQYMPVAVYACIGVTLFGFAIAGVTNGVHKFNDSLIEGICLSDTTYLRFSQFLRNVKSPLNTLETDFNVAVDKLSAAATIDKQLSQNVQDIATKMGELKTAAKNAKATIPTANPTLRAGCEAFWQEIIDGAKAAETETTTSANNLDSQLQSVQTEIDKSLVSGKDSAKASLKTAKETIDTMQSQLDVSLDPRAYNLMQLASDIKGQKDNSGFSSFGWVFVSLIFVTTSIFGVHECKHHTTLTSPPRDNPKMPLNVIKLNHTGECFARLAAVGWCCALFFGIFCGIFAAVMLPLSAVMTDVCVVLPTLPSQLGELSGSQDISNIVTTCWNSTGNLLDGLGLSSSIDVNAIDFDSFDENFGGDVTIDTTELEKMVKTLDSGDSSNCGDMTTVKTKTNAVITQSNFAATEFQESTIVLQLKEEGRKIIALLQKAIDDFKTATNCYFVKVIWDDVSNVVCVSLRDSIQWWGKFNIFNNHYYSIFSDHLKRYFFIRYG